MKIETHTTYSCGDCRKKYSSKDDALTCEKRDEAEKRRANLIEFEIKEEHLKLLKEMNVEWDDYKFGAPNIDPKRPYGNSDGIDDVARIIGFEKNKKTAEFDKEDAKEYETLTDYFEEIEWTDESQDYLFSLHKEMQIVLQIVLSTLSFQKGKYRRKDPYTSEWVKAPEDA